MKKIYVDGKKFDWNLSHSQKKAVAWTVGAFSIGALIFSTLSTANAMMNICKDITFVGYKIGLFIAVLITALISAGEMSCIYLAVWKKNLWWLLPTIGCAYVSVCGTVGFMEISSQNANIKKSEIAGVEKIISDKESEIVRIEGRIDQYSKLINNGMAKTWTYTRLRQAEEKLSSSTNELAKLRNQKTEIEKKHGAIVSLTDGKDNKNMSIGIAIAVEIFLVGSTFLGIGIYQSSTNDDEKCFINEHRKLIYLDRDVNQGATMDNVRAKTEFVQSVEKTNSGLQDNNLVDKKFGSKCETATKNDRNVAPQPQPKTQPDNETKKELIDLVERSGGKSDPVILHFWDSGYTNMTEIGRLVGTVLPYQVTRQYVTKVLKREGRLSK